MLLLLLLLMFTAVVLKLGLVASESLRHLLVLKILFICFQRGEGRQKERERSIDVRESHRLIACHTRPDQGRTRNPGMCPDWESNPGPFAVQDGTQPTEPHRSGLT